MWAQTINLLLGVWLMFAPYILGYSDLASHSDHVVGPLVATFSAIALWEVTRGMRWANLPLALWLIVGPWFLQFEQTALINSLLVGVCVAGLSLVRGRITQEFGGGWAMLWRAP